VKQRSGHKGVDGINGARDRTRAVRWKDFGVVSLGEAKDCRSIRQPPPLEFQREKEREATLCQRFSRRAIF